MGFRTPTLAEFFFKMKEKNYEVYESLKKPFNLNIVGWRNKEGVSNSFDDYIAVYYLLPHQRWAASFFKATTLPGIPFLEHPLNTKGAALLKPGQYKGAYALGLHKGKEALVQVKDVTVYRDNNKDRKFDVGLREETGVFGINIHRAGRFSRYVGLSSAGCQVFKESDEFEKFIALCKQSADKWGNSFTYTVLEF